MATDLLQQLQTSLGDEYLIERELGGGGMSHVFLAEERRFGRRVVIKVLRSDLSAEVSAERFEREIRLAAKLQDPRIVQLLQAGHVGNLRFYTMPYVEGESLRARMARGPLPIDEATGLLRDVALALEYAHARQVVHRDIKPENVLLSGRTAVVTDFGIAKAISAATMPLAGSTLTNAGMIIGTPSYMSPEQASGGVVDARTDLYAWGVMAYELLAGEHPFAERTSLQAMLAAQITDPAVPLARRHPQVPAALAALVDRCLAKDPNQRPADAGELVDRLGAATRHAETPSRARGWTGARIGVAVASVALVSAMGWLYVQSQHRHWARDVAPGEVTRLRAADQNLAAFLTAERASAYLPADTLVARVQADVSATISVTSTPPGAAVSIQNYTPPDSGWYALGTTPIKSVRVPQGYFRWKLARPGGGELVVAPFTREAMRFNLDSSLAAPAGMVLVPPRTWVNYVAFVGTVGPFRLPAFYMDRYEVTNREYQAFVDSGGYDNAKYWTEPFVQNGHALTREQAMALFRDRSGRPGPSTWDGGHYPDGQANYPVSGVSWYEASAYAAFAGKSLPAFAQWYEAAPGDAGRYVVPASNMSRTALAPVGAFKGIGPFGTYDMAGNVREWTLNAVAPDFRFILGGDWMSQPYLYADPESLSPFDRSPGNGFRCVRNVQPLPPGAAAPVKPQSRDFAAFRPASDAVFNAHRVVYEYDRTPLNARDEGTVADTNDWREEKVTFDAAYGNERVTAYLFLPKRVRPPYQTIVFFPSARAVSLHDSHQLGDITFFDYAVKSGRAVIYPIYQGTYERVPPGHSGGIATGMTLVAQRAKDVSRTIDYLATRPDIAMNKLAYLGVSLGAAEGVIYSTLVQDRLKTVVLLDGGYFLFTPAPTADQADFAPRLKIPVLMVNGRFDFSFPLERSQDPLFRMLGTPAADKRHVVMETPHDVRADRPRLTTEVLGWLDKYLGRVE